MEESLWQSLNVVQLLLFPFSGMKDKTMSSFATEQLDQSCIKERLGSA